MNEKQTRSALDRILAAIKTEVDAGHCGYLDAMNWVYYAMSRDEAIEQATLEPDEHWSVQEQLEVEFESQLEDAEEVISDNFDSIISLASGIDPDFATPIDPETVTTWL